MSRLCITRFFPLGTFDAVRLHVLHILQMKVYGSINPQSYMNLSVQPSLTAIDISDHVCVSESTLSLIVKYLLPVLGGIGKLHNHTRLSTHKYG
jgi:hypothetical protein